VYVILGTITVRPEHLEEFLVHVREHAAASAREPGCVRYDVLQDTSDPLIVCLYEVFRREADLEVHHQQPHYQRWMALSRDWRDRSSYSRRVLRNVYPADEGFDLRRSSFGA
jgi:(4S)-4-hydroxy-5-phosphonooxypentane-2,3-dione isomerase